jgi:RNA polymerase sigma-70 factor (ECF subfamily)
MPWPEDLQALEQATSSEPDREFIEAERRRVVGFALEKVRDASKPTTWACFEEHILKGRRAADVAGQLGITTNALYVNASRVQARVREQCRQYLEELGDA